MKNFNEKHKLPLTFKYMEISKSKNIRKVNSNLKFYLECEKYQTDYHVRLKPYKPLVKML